MSLTNRIREAWGILTKADERPSFGSATSPFDEFRYSNWGWQRNSVVIDFGKEIGPLDGNSLVMAVVNYTGSRLPEAKPAVVMKNEDGDEEIDHDHRLAKLISQPNPHHVWADYALACSMSWWIDGNVYFKKVRDITEEIQELWYLPWYLVEPRWLDDGCTPVVPKEKKSDSFLSHYQFNVPGRTPDLIPAKDMVHLKRGVNNSNPRKG